MSEPPRRPKRVPLVPALTPGLLFFPVHKEAGWFTGAPISLCNRERTDRCTHSDPKDPLKFAIVERFVNEASQTYHLNVRPFT